MTKYPNTEYRMTKSGFTLIELSLAISLTFVMLSTGVYMIHILLRAERTSNQTIEQTRSISRLSRKVRSDVHAASKARLVPANADEAVAIELERPNQLVRYTVSSDGLGRIEFRAGEIQSRERILLMPETTVDFEIIGEPDRVRVVIRRPRSDLGLKKTTGTQENRSVVIEAVVGRDLRFQVPRK